MTEKGKKQRTLVGTVVTDSMDKTVVVSVERYVKHPKYKKYMRRQKRYKAHDPENSYKVGDRVKIAPSKPMSKDKKFVVISKL